MLGQLRVAQQLRGLGRRRGDLARRDDAHDHVAALRRVFYRGERDGEVCRDEPGHAAHVLADAERDLERGVERVDDDEARARLGALLHQVPAHGVAALGLGVQPEDRERRARPHVGDEVLDAARNRVEVGVDAVREHEVGQLEALVEDLVRGDVEDALLVHDEHLVRVVLEAARVPLHRAREGLAVQVGGPVRLAHVRRERHVEALIFGVVDLLDLVDGRVEENNVVRVRLK